MTALHGTMRGAEVDALRLPLTKKLSAISELSAHIVTFRGQLARLATARRALLVLDAYRLFLVSLFPFPVFHQYALLFTVTNGAIGQQTFEAYAAYSWPSIPTSSPTPAFDPSRETLKGTRAERVRMMGWEGT